jgi:hypothetical protein
MLNTDPSARPNISEVIFHLENIAQTKSFQFTETLSFLKKTDSLLQQQNNTFNNSINNNQFQPQSGSSTFYTNNNNNNNANSNQTQSNYNWMGNASSLFKGNYLLKTIKEASSKVMDSVQK